MAFAANLFFWILIFGTVGLGMEVVVTALFPRTGENRGHLFGYSSLWYLPLYGFLVPLGFMIIYPLVADLPLLIRGVAYTPFFHLSEYCGMWYLRYRNGESPSEESYKQAKWNIHGLTRLDYAPLFFFASLIFEKLCRSMNVN